VKIAVFGAGYVGLVTGACLADLGHDVVIRDIVSGKIDTLRSGGVPIHEPGLADLLERNAERLSFTTEVAEALDGAEVVYVAVGTPPTVSGDADLTAVWTVVDELPASLDRRVVLAMKSTVPVGTGAAVRHRLDERSLENVGYVSNPEFTAEGTAVDDFMRPDRIVVGSFDPADGDVVESLHAGIDAPVIRCDVASAEMIKLAANAALMMRVSFINEIANVCEATGTQAARRQLRLPLPASRGGHRGERAPEAPCHQQARAAARWVAAREEDRASRTRLQAGHGRHARGA
jgi:UDPglucose 6-dehydrogenase